MFFKFDPNTGYGDVICRSDINNNKERLCFSGWDHEMFALFCVLSGCDYIQKVPELRMGIVKAYKIVSKHVTFENVTNQIRTDYPAHAVVDVDAFIRGVFMALLTFKHQTVCHNSLTLSFLNATLYLTWITLLFLPLYILL